MAALLVALSIMAVLMTAVMPVWKQMAQREKEAELVFRGQQYIRAIGLFQRRTGPTLPPNVDVLVDQHFLRKKYKDPITGEDFLLIPGATAGTPQPGQGAQFQGLPGSNTGRGTTGSGSTGSTPSPYIAQGGPFGTSVPGGVTGVVSKSADASIRLFNGRGHYNEWEFRFTPPPAQQQQQGGGGPNQPQRGGGTGPPTGGPGQGRGPVGGVRGQTGPNGTTFEPVPGGRGLPPGGTPPPGGPGRGPVGR